MQRVKHPGDRDGPRGRHERLGQHLSAEDTLQLSVRLPRPEQPDFDLLQVQKVDELGDGLWHTRSLVPGSRLVVSTARPYRPPKNYRGIQLI
jgi:hypothetical protein